MFLVVLSGGDSMLNCIVFFWLSIFLAIVLISTGLPSNFASVDWRFCTDFLISSAITVGNVFFWLSLFGDGDDFSEAVDECSSFTLDDVFSGFFLLCCLLSFFSIAFAPVWKLNPRVGVLVVGESRFFSRWVLLGSLFVGLLCGPRPSLFDSVFLRDPLLFVSWTSVVVERLAARC